MRLNHIKKTTFTSMYATRIGDTEKIENFSAEEELKKITTLTKNIKNNEVKPLPPDKDLSLFKFPNNEYLYADLSINNQIKILDSRNKKQIVIETNRMPENVLAKFNKLIQYLIDIARKR